jgi:hypothetical protein
MKLITRIVIVKNTMINQNDINYLVDLLEKSIKNQDWDLVLEAQEYLIDFQDEPSNLEE